MIRKSRNRPAVVAAGLAAGLLLAWTCSANAGPPRYRRAGGPVPTGYYRSVDTAPSPMLGSFYPAPYVYGRGPATYSGGYAPLGMQPGYSMGVYGPLSALRATTAPVLLYSSGYDGVVRPSVGYSFSTPNAPGLSPIVYPTRANLYGGFRQQDTPPWWDSAVMTIDMQ